MSDLLPYALWWIKVIPYNFCFWNLKNTNSGDIIFLPNRTWKTLISKRIKSWGNYTPVRFSRPNLTGDVSTQMLFIFEEILFWNNFPDWQFTAEIDIFCVYFRIDRNDISLKYFPITWSKRSHCVTYLWKPIKGKFSKAIFLL